MTTSDLSLHAASFSANVERFSGFADAYDRFRPSPPLVLADILTRLAGSPLPDLVVDLGSGTGLSTRYWAERARRVIGVEPTDDMRRQAEAQTAAANISYRSGYSHETGLPAGCADLVVCAQSLHWMAPQATFEEARRILRPGGVFASCDYDWPPVTGSWPAESAYLACQQRMVALITEHRSGQGLRQWDKDGHQARMQSSGCFRFAREVVVHHTEPGNAERLIGLMLSQGGIMALLKAGVSVVDIGLDVFRRDVQRSLGDDMRVWYWCSRLRIGIV